MRHLILLLFVLLLSCKENKNDALVSKGDWHFDKGDHCYNRDQDSSYHHFLEARNYFEKGGDTRGVARTLMYIAILQTNKGDFFGSNETSIEALEHANKNKNKNKDLYYIIYNQFGLNYELLKDYENANLWYKKAYDAATKIEERFLVATNLGIVSYKRGKYREASNIYRTLMEHPQLKNFELLHSRVLGNYAYSKFLEDRKYNAEKDLLSAQRKLEQLDDVSGLRRVHSHLAEYYAQANKEKALFHAKTALDLSKKMNSPDRSLEAYKKIILLESPENVQKYFFQHQRLTDSLQTARAIARNQFALIRYEANNEKLENAKKQNQILKLYFSLFVLSLALIFGYYWYRRRKKILEQQKAMEVKNTELKFSKKVHDVVANGLYQTMMEVERQENLDREKVLSALEKMYEESRDISHENLDQNNAAFSAQLGQMISSFSSEAQKVIVVQNSEKIWSSVSPQHQHEIFLALRELMTNMRKHSQATHVTVKFGISERALQIKYSDNGVGLKSGSENKGKGLENTENRILESGGKIKFEQNEKSGLIVLISMPLDHHV